MPDDGVNVVGYVHDRTGLGGIARLLIASLERGGIPYSVVAVGARPLRERLRRPAARFDTNIVCVNAQLLPGLVEEVGRSFLRERRTIGFWWWEIDRFPAVMSWASHLVDEVWVGSEHVRNAIEPTVSKPVFTFPLPIARPPVAPVRREMLGIPDRRFAFVFSFSFWSVFERKNPLGLIDAFSRAFSPDDGPVLVVKTVAGKQFPRELAQLRSAASRRRDIFVVDRTLSAPEYHGFVASCDAYASLHRAEGFGLTIAEAMALGKPAVATSYSGNLEFMSEENSYLVPYRLVPIPANVEPYVAGGFWAEPDADAAAALLRRVVDCSSEAREKAATALSELPERRSFEAAAAFVRERLAATTPPGQLPDDPVERAAYELMWGPNFEAARPWARQARKLVRPFVRPYVEHQRRVGALMLEALRVERTRRSEHPAERGRKGS